MGPRADLDGCGRSRPTGIQSPDRPAPCVVAIHTIPAHLVPILSQIDPCSPNQIFKSLQILPSHPRLVLPRCLFTSNFSVISLYAHLVSPLRVTCSTHFIPRSLVTPKFTEATIMKLLIMKFSPVSCLLLTLKPKYLLSTTLSNTLRRCSTLNVRDQNKRRPPP